MAVYAGDDITFKMGDAASPEVFTAIGQVTGFSEPDNTFNFLTQYFIGSTTPTKTPTTENLGQSTVEIVLDPDDTQHALLRTNKTANTLTNFQIVVSGATAGTFAFSGYVAGLPASGGAEDALTASVTIETTAVTPWA